MSVPRPMFHNHRSAPVLAAIGALVLAWSGPAFAAQADSTTVEPAGAAFAPEMTGSATLTAGSTVVTRDVSSTLPGGGNNQVPDAPDNHNPGGPVVGTINAPGFSDCDTNMPFVGATVTVNDAEWEISMQHGDPSTGTMVVPAEGIVVQTSGLASCTATVSPGGPVGIDGVWTNGDPASTLAFDTSAPVEVVGGFGCPTNTTQSNFTATYEVTNADSRGGPVTVSP